MRIVFANECNVESVGGYILWIEGGGIVAIVDKVGIAIPQGKQLLMPRRNRSDRISRMQDTIALLAIDEGIEALDNSVYRYLTCKGACVEIQSTPLLANIS